MAVQEGAKYLEKVFGGRGVLLGGVPGVAPAEVVILGGGVVGINAAKMAAGLGAHVTILDISLDRLRYLDDVLPANVDTLYSNRHNILDAIERADLVDRRRAAAGRQGAAPGQARRPQADAAGRGDRRRRGRPGRLRRDDQARRRTRTRPTSSTASCTTACRTCRAACRAPPPWRSPTRRCPTGLKLAKHGLEGRLRGRPRRSARPQRGRRARWSIRAWPRRSGCRWWTSASVLV